MEVALAVSDALQTRPSLAGHYSPVRARLQRVRPANLVQQLT